MNKIIVAAQFANNAHKGQVRRYTGRPYITHPARVAGMVAAYPVATEEMVIAAYLHDVVEDTNITLQEIYEEFGSTVGTYVDQLTNKSKGKGLNREARKKLDREHLSFCSREVKLIKLFDRIDNLRELPNDVKGFKEMYKKESILLAEFIGDADEDLKKELLSLC